MKPPNSQTTHPRATTLAAPAPNPVDRGNPPQSRAANGIPAASGDTLGRAKPMNPIERAHAHPSSLRAAINGKCFDCQGGGADPGTKVRIGQCGQRKCCLWLVRPYQHRAVDDSEAD